MSITTQNGEFAVALQWEKYADGYPEAIKAQGYVTFLANAADADTLTIAGIAYRFKTTPAALGDIKIGTTLALTLINLLAALQGTATGGTAYYAGTKPLLTVDAELGTAKLFLESYVPGQVGNAITLAQGGTGVTARYTLSGATLSGGINGGAQRSALGRIAFAAMPLDTETLTVGSTTYTFSSSLNTGNNINITLTTQDDVGELATAVGLRLESNAAVENVSVLGNTVSFRTTTDGAAGNAIVLSETVVAAASVQVTGAGTLTGGLDATLLDVSTLSWKKLRSRDVDYADNQMQDTIPLEVGGTLTPTGAYKQGVNVMGGAQIMPRLENSVGLLLLATLGKATTTNPSTGVYQHVFTFQTNEINQPWLAARRMIPGRDNIYGNGIIGYDNKVNLFRTTVAAASPVEVMLQMMGRFPIMDNHPETWLGSSFEDFESIPLACRGTFKLPTVEGLPNPLPVTQVVAEMVNVTTTPREEMVVGSYYMDDVVTRTRVLTFRFVYKWRDANLANYLFGNQLRASAWSPVPFVTETSGTDYAVDLLVESPNNIEDTTTPYSLRIRANKVFWQPQPVRLRAGDIVMLEMVGTVLYDSGGYCEFVLINGQTAYSVPSEP